MRNAVVISANRISVISFTTYSRNETCCRNKGIKCHFGEKKRNFFKPQLKYNTIQLK